MFFYRIKLTTTDPWSTFDDEPVATTRPACTSLAPMDEPKFNRNQLPLTLSGVSNPKFKH